MASFDVHTLSLETGGGEGKGGGEGRRSLAVTPHGLLGCQDERSEAGQRLGQLQERVLREKRPNRTHDEPELRFSATMAVQVFHVRVRSLPAAVPCPSRASPRPSPDSGTGRT